MAEVAYIVAALDKFGLYSRSRIVEKQGNGRQDRDDARRNGYGRRRRRKERFGSNNYRSDDEPKQAVGSLERIKKLGND